MSSERSLFSNLIASKSSIHIANKDIIYSTHIGTFHLHTKLNSGQPITIDLHDSLLVPDLNGTTLVSDQSLLKFNFVITLGQNDIHMNLGKQQIALSLEPTTVSLLFQNKRPNQLLHL
jgi:hypothetical protein